MSSVFDTHFDDWRDFPTDEWRWRNFMPAEVACRDGSLMVNEYAMDCLQRLREAAGAPMIVNSAYRSPTYNRKVGGAKRSQHLKAKAFDISMANHDPHEFAEHARAVGFHGFGFYPHKNFMHIDTRTTPATWGTPFKDRRGDRFASPDITPERPPVAKPVKGGAAVAMGATAAVSALMDQVADLSPVIKTLADVGPGALAIFAVAFAVFLYRDEIKNLFGDGDRD